MHFLYTAKHLIAIQFGTIALVARVRTSVCFGEQSSSGALDELGDGLQNRNGCYQWLTGIEKTLVDLSAKKISMRPQKPTLSSARYARKIE